MSIRDKENFYNIESIEDGIYFVSETDIKEIAKYENPNDYLIIGKLNKETKNTSDNSLLAAATIKVFVAYTPTVAQNYNVSELINQSINTTIIAFNNSLVSSNIELVGSAQLTYTESGSATTDINRFVNYNDGYLDEIHSLRNQYEADICVLLVNSLDENGIVASIGANFNNAFCIVKADATVSNYSFPHELGHLFGCRHDSDTGVEPYEYAHGFNWFGKLSYNPNPRYYRTIMSIEDPNKYMRVQYFSNPQVHDQLNNPMGMVNYNYCASALDDYASILAALEPHYTTSGTLIVSEWWGNVINLSGNITVPSGITLTIKSSAIVNLNNHTITSSGGTISVQSGATVNPYIPLKQSSTIKGLYTSVQTAVNAAASGSTIELQNTTYSGSLCFSSKSGIALSGAGSSIISNGISLTNSDNIAISGMRLGTSLSINGGHDNSFSNSTATGSTALTNYGSTYLSVTYITAENIEASFGVISNGGSGTLNHSSIQNGDCAVYLTNSADWDVRSGNQFCGNGYDITATLPTYAYVTDNTSYSSSSPFSGSGVDVEPTEYPLSICGTAKAVAVKSNETESSFNPVLKELAKKHLDLLREINKGRENEKFDLRDYKIETDELINDYKKLLNNDNTSETINAAISKIGELYKGQENNNGFYNFIEETIASGNFKTIYPYLKRHLIWKAIDEKDYDNSLKIADEVLASSGISENLQAEMLYEKGLVYKYYLEDLVKANELFNQIIKKYPVNDMIYFANSELGKEGDELRNQNDEGKQAGSTSSLEFGSSSYPNPFNPTTTISYTLPTDGIVTVKVFDMLGREVRTLVNDYKNAGGYNVIWDSNDSFGSEVSSGIYFYNIKFRDNSITKKMILVR